MTKTVQPDALLSGAALSSAPQPLAPQPLAEERLRLIVALLAERGSARTTEIGARLGISGSTVRRDLEELSARGLIRKVHGGATLSPSDSGPDRNEDQGYSEREQQQRGGKARLARLALTLMQPGQTVYLDAGSTALEVALALREQPALTRTLRVVTHGVNVAYELNGECALYVVGGENYGSTYSLVGPDTLAAVERHRYDLFLVGCTTIDPQRGPTNSNLIEAQLKAAIIGQSARSLLIADASKWGPPGFAVFAPFAALSAWVTDRVPQGAAAVCAGAGVEVLSAGGAEVGRGE